MILSFRLLVFVSLPFNSIEPLNCFFLQSQKGVKYFFFHSRKWSVNIYLIFSSLLSFVEQLKKNIRMGKVLKVLKVLNILEDLKVLKTVEHCFIGFAKPYFWGPQSLDKANNIFWRNFVSHYHIFNQKKMKNLWLINFIWQQFGWSSTKYFD